MKKLLLLMLVLFGGVMQMSAKTISLKPNSWTEEGWCALWVWGDGTTAQWKNLADVTPSDGIYDVTVDDKVTGWKLVRGNGSTPSFDNDKCWNQSGDLSASDNFSDYYYNFDKIDNNITLDKGISKKAYIHSCSIIGDFTSFTIGNEIEMTQDPSDVNVYTLVQEFDVTAKKYYYKLIANHKYGVYELPNSGNNEFTFNEAGRFQLTFTANVSTHTLTLSAKKVVTIGSSGKSTFSSKDAHNFTGIDNIKSYVVSELTSTYAKLTEVPDVPSYTGVLLVGNAGTYYIPYGGATSLPSGVTNYLQASTDGVTVSADQAYVLSNGEFHPANAGTIPAGKAYLNANDIPGAVPGARLSLIFDEATGINTIENVQLKNDNNAPMYNLAGQRVGKNYKGVVIQNGKKMLMK